jgi:3-hydroxyisobutyrate dehydrogenase-like beta-hydroxyacid dehydrogenase
MGGAVHHAGGAGAGAAVKLALNALFGIQAAAMAEILGLLEHVGVDKTRGMEILGATPVTSPAAKMLGSAMLNKQFAPLFPIDLVEKDFGYVAATAEDGGAKTPISEAARRVFAAAKNAGHGGDNITGVARLHI